MTVRVLFCAGSLHGGGSKRQLWQLATHLPPEPAEQRATIAKRWVVEQYDFPRWLLRAQELIISCLETKTLSENQQRIEHK